MVVLDYKYDNFLDVIFLDISFPDKSPLTISLVATFLGRNSSALVTLFLLSKQNHFQATNT